MIKATNISKSFGKKKVIDNIDLSVEKGEIISIIGPSGAGKTTLMNIIGTLEKPDSKNYSLLINKIETSKLLENEISKFRNNELGFVFQFHELLPEFTAQENICIPAMIKGVKKKEYLEKSEMLINILNISRVKDQRPNELSGGEQQRVAIARSMLNDPKLIIADEPTGNLDPETSLEIISLFKKLNSMGTSMIIATHDYNLILKLDGEVYKCEDGSIFEVKRN